VQQQVAQADLPLLGWEILEQNSVEETALVYPAAPQEVAEVVLPGLPGMEEA
jgi:hypothetical protein